MNKNIHNPLSYLLLGVMLAFSFSVSVFAEAPDQSEPKEQKEEKAEKKVWICHYPSDDLNNPNLLNIAESAWLNAHSEQHEEDFLVSNYESGYECPPKGDVPVNTPPVITLIGNSTITIVEGSAFSDPGATASDAEDGDITPDIVVGGDSVDVNVPGTYVITYNVEDEDGADAPQVTRTVIVEEDEDEDPEYPYGVIIAPTPSQSVSGLLTLVAKYFDGDEVNDDAVQWAVRKGTCAAGTNTVFGNVDGKSNSFTWDGTDFSADLDFSEEDEGSYCFIFNPTDDGPVDVRETVNFVVDHDDVGPVNTAPVITLIGSSTVYVTLGDAYVDAGATVNDAEDDPEPTLVVGGLPVNVNALGTTTVTYDATDSDSLAAVQVTRTVVVVEAEGDNGDGDEDDDTDPVPPADEDDEDEDRRSGRSGSRISRGSSSGEVLGAVDEQGSCGMYLFEYLRIGQANNAAEVSKLQSFLNDQGFAVPVTGFFGPLTHDAVKAFQASRMSETIAPWVTRGYANETTGYVYKTTRHTINNIVCPGSEAYPVLE